MPSRRPARALGRRRGWTMMAAAAAAAAAAACRSVVDPKLPDGAVALTPPPVYARWWAMVESCAGAARPFADVRWYEVPLASSVPSASGQGHASGYYSRPGNQVVLAGQAKLDGGIVRHEMLHALLRDEAGHPRAQFLGRCAGVVDCEQSCVEDAGAPPPAPPGARVVAPAGLTLRAEVAPAAPAASRDEGWFTLTVTATNAGPDPVVVRLTESALAFAFGFRVANTGGETADARRALDPAAAWFAPGETKRQVFDFRVRAGPAREPGVREGDAAFAPGLWAVWGTVGSRDAEARSPVLVVEFGP